MSEESQNVQALLQEAITAGRAGERERARELLKQVVQLDPESEKAWYALASLAETPEERRVYLGNVVQINPGNERAQAMLARLESGEATAKPKSSLDREIIPGITRRMAIFGGAGIAILIVVVCGALAVVFSMQQQAAAEQQATANAIQAAAQATQEILATGYAEATELAALEGNTPTPPGPTLPPTWTPLPMETATEAGQPTPRATALGSGVFSGRLLIASGTDLSGLNFVPLLEVPLDGSEPRTLYDGRGGSPSRSPRGDRLIYTRFSSGTREQGLEIVWLDGSRTPQLLSVLLGGRILSLQDDGSFSPDGSAIAFSAREPGSARSDIFTLALDTLLAEGEDIPDEIAAQALQRLTDGTTDDTAPTWADSTHLVYVSDGRDTGGVVDLRLFALGSSYTQVTSDGNILIEDNPSISPDGTTVAFEAYSPENPDDVDIFVTPINGQGASNRIVDSEYADVRPRWSPDGSYLVFSSNRTGNWEVFIVDALTFAIYQVTVNDVIDIANDWVP